MATINKIEEGLLYIGIILISLPFIINIIGFIYSIVYFLNKNKNHNNFTKFNKLISKIFLGILIYGIASFFIFSFISQNFFSFLILQTIIILFILTIISIIFAVEISYSLFNNNTTNKGLIKRVIVILIIFFLIYFYLYLTIFI